MSWACRKATAGRSPAPGPAAVPPDLSVCRQRWPAALPGDATGTTGESKHNLQYQLILITNSSGGVPFFLFSFFSFFFFFLLFYFSFDFFFFFLSLNVKMRTPIFAATSVFSHEKLGNLRCMHRSDLSLMCEPISPALTAIPSRKVGVRPFQVSKSSCIRHTHAMTVQAFVLTGSANCLFSVHFSKRTCLCEQNCKLERRLSRRPGPETKGVGKTSTG